MAFKTPDPKTITWATGGLPGGIEQLTIQHESAVKALLAAADAAGGPMDTARTLAAIKAYREAMQGETGPRDTIRRLARYLITAGLPPGRVCRGLGFGRTWMNAYMKKEPAFAPLIEPGTKSTRKAA
jgi:hypothetical protein